jgi:sigma-B regulation protein RsbU (phosphoserine phosphatase)
MRILVAEDEPVTARILEASLRKWGHEVSAVPDGEAALAALVAPGAPRAAILDWNMPGLSGEEVCRRVRAAGLGTHLLLVTARSDRESVRIGLASGADDYITKPFDSEELRLRVKAAERVVLLEDRLADRVRELEKALAELGELRGLLAMCMYCKGVRVRHDHWQTVENYLVDHGDVQVSHGICPTCHETIVKPELEAFKREQREKGAWTEPPDPAP